MDKEEAIKILKDFHDKSALFSVRTALHTIIPELYESEDERIRKELIDAINGLWDNDALPMPLSVKRKDAWLAWLEKQGEKNPTDEETKTILRTEYEKGRADVLRCIDPDEMVADFCSQPLSKTRSIASVYRQGITDILKRINSNEENSITGTCSIDNCGL